MTGFALRVLGRGLVVRVNDKTLETYEEAERAAKFIREALLEECEIERLLLDVAAAEDAT